MITRFGGCSRFICLFCLFMKKYFNISHISAGFIAVLVGYTSSAAIVFHAAMAAGVSAEHVSSWLFALGIGMGVTCIALSLRFRSPVLTAWSTPGAALLTTSLVGVSIDAAIGAFIVASALIAICGFTNLMDAMMKHIPRSLSAGMLAGVLLNFGMGVFTSVQQHWLLVGVMLAVYLLGRRTQSRYTIPLTFAAGLACAILSGQLSMSAVALEFSTPLLTMPTFSWSAAISVGVPLFVVTMTSQNIPGIAVLRANGYATPVSPLIGWTGVTGLLLAPLGGFSFNLAAITAAICASPEADPDPKSRYLAAVWAGMFYLLTGVLGATIASLLTAMPHALVAAIAGIALFGTIGNSLANCVLDEGDRESGVVTFLVTASGMTLFGVGSAFWGLVFGMLVYKMLAVFKA